ncbi:uncharacterized protein B0P05DRAFT_570635 [Gilbertella persicaria]|uniref:uncharacterized protein n=1 Tax=Gilbertella persicaria TaxID=101096 RepID=UPI00221EBEB9|nr:uncharacterized protein B0P05DRAFT_570635 [Gilbertella persicaria]KAI8083288.1 hypothetical protein B0P05DRAFT_570635 [Gilbertella persicaria]
MTSTAGYNSSQEVKVTKVFRKALNTYLLPLILTPSSPGQWRSYSALSPHQEKLSHLADFYRALATQDIDRIWPLYTYLYHNDMLSYLTKRNYYQLFTYTVRSRACQKNLHRLLAIVDDMRMKGYGLRVGEYNAVIHWVGGKTVPTLHTRHLIDALTWFEDMQKSSWRDEKSGQEQHQDPVQPTIVTFNSLIHIAAELSDLRTAQKLYHDMMSRGIEPDRMTYATLLHAMSRIGDVEGMDSMLKDLRQKRLHHVISSTLIWNVLMTGYATHGHKKKAYDMFNQMLQMTSNKTRRKKRRSIPTVDAESFKICIDLMLQDNRQAKAIQLLFRMKEYNIQPIVTIYNTLFASFKQPQDLALLKSVYQHMKETQVKPNSDTMYL